MVCAICGEVIRLASACHDAHPDHCHACTELSMRAGYDSREHPPPRPSASPREEAAVAAYRRHVVRTGGTGPLGVRVREDTP